MKKTREANYFDVGVQGRKTGITLRQGQRDEFGLELIDGIFSPVASAPSKDVAAVATEKEITTPTTTHVLTDRRLNHNIITPGRNSNSLLPPPPPRSRSPIKTSLNSPPRRPPSSPGKSIPKSPPYQGLNGTPKRGISHPSPAAKKRRNVEENTVRPIVRSSTTVVRVVSPRRSQGTPLRKDLPGRDVVTEERGNENKNVNGQQQFQTSPGFNGGMVDEQDIGAWGHNANNRDGEEDLGMGGQMGSSFQPFMRHATESNFNEFDDMDDSMQLVQYDDDDGGRGEQDNQVHSPGTFPYGQEDDPESDKDYMPTPGGFPFRPVINDKSQSIHHADSQSPVQATTFPTKRGRGRPPKSRTLVFQDFRDSDLEDEQGRPRKVIRNDQDSYLSSSGGGGGGGGGNVFSKPAPLLRDPTSRVSMSDSGVTITPEKRGPGRPRKIQFDGTTPVIGGNSSQTLRGDSTDNGSQVVKRGPGRPRKSEISSTNSNNPMVVTSQGDQWMNGDLQENPMVDEERSNGFLWKRLDSNQDVNQQRIERHSVDPSGLLGDSQQRDILLTNNSITHYQRGSSVIQNPPNQPSLSPPPPQASTTAENLPPGQPVKRGRGRPKGSKNKPKDGSGQASQSSSSKQETLEPWEEDPGIITGAVRLWDSELESSLDYLVEEEIAYSSTALSSFSSVANGSFRYAKALTLDFFGTGIVEIPPGGSKSARNARKMHMAFCVIRGKVLVECAGTKFRIGSEGMWHVPRGNVYSIKNDGDHPAKLFFAQACETRSRVGFGGGGGGGEGFVGGGEGDEDVGRGRATAGGSSRGGRIGQGID